MMFGLLKKDIYLFFKNFTGIYLVALIVGILPLLQKPRLLFPMMAFLLAVILATQVSTTMTLDEKANWKKMVSGMPVSEKSEVASKYILSFIFAIAGFLLVLIIGALFMVLPSSLNMNWREAFMASELSFCLILLYNAIIIPSIYKFGAEKSRTALLVTVVLLPTLIIFVLKMFGIDPYSIRLDHQMLSLVAFVFVLSVEMISWFFSIKILRDRH